MSALAVNGQLQPDAPVSAAQLLREAPRGAYTAATLLPGIGVRHQQMLEVNVRRDAVSAGRTLWDSLRRCPAGTCIASALLSRSSC